MKIKKLTELEVSELRDKVAIELCASFVTTGATVSSSTNRAYSLADQFVHDRRVGHEEVDMKCRCNDNLSIVPKELKKKRLIPNTREEVNTYKVPAKINASTGKPPIWAMIIMGVVTVAGIWAIGSKVVEFIKWLF